MCGGGGGGGDGGFLKEFECGSLDANTFGKIFKNRNKLFDIQKI